MTRDVDVQIQLENEYEQVIARLMVPSKAVIEASVVRWKGDYYVYITGTRFQRTRVLELTGKDIFA